MIRAVIFDCFGVIIADALAILHADLQRKDPAAAQQVADIVAASSRGLIEREESTRRMAELFGISPDELRQKVRDGEIKDQRVLDLAATLRRHYKTAMLSNAGAASLASRFTQMESQAAFDVVVASGEIGFAKPEPQAYEITADRLGVRLGECVMIDDREDYCEGARAVGMQAILYQNFTQAKQMLEQLLANA